MFNYKSYFKFSILVLEKLVRAWARYTTRLRLKLRRTGLCLVYEQEDAVQDMRL